MASTTIEITLTTGLSLTIPRDHPKNNTDDEMTWTWTAREVQSIRKHIASVVEQIGRWDVMMRKALDGLLPIYKWNQDPQSSKIEAAMLQWDIANAAAGIADTAPKVDLPQQVSDAAMNMANSVLCDNESVKRLFSNIYRFLGAFMVHYRANLERATNSNPPNQTLVDAINELSSKSAGIVEDNELEYHIPGIACVAISDFMRQYFRFWYECRVAHCKDLIAVHLSWEALEDAVYNGKGEDYDQVVDEFKQTCPEGKSPMHTVQVDELDRLVYHCRCGTEFERLLSHDKLWALIEQISPLPPVTRDLLQGPHSLKSLSTMKW